MILVVAALAAAAFGGWWLANSVASTRPVTIDSFFTGKVSEVSSDGSAICVVPDTGGSKQCGAPFQQGGAPSLHPGDHVGVAVERVQTARQGESIEIYLIYSPPPTP